MKLRRHSIRAVAMLDTVERMVRMGVEPNQEESILEHIAPRISVSASALQCVQVLQGREAPSLRVAVPTRKDPQG